MDDDFDARDDSALIDAFDTACARYPHGWEAAAPVEGVDAAPDDDGAAAAEPPAAAPLPTNLPAPPASSFVAPPLPAGAAPPFPSPPASGDDFGDLLSSWYYAGYYTGLQEARAAAAAKRAGSDS